MNTHELCQQSQLPQHNRFAPLALTASFAILCGCTGEVPDSSSNEVIGRAIAAMAVPPPTTDTYAMWPSLSQTTCSDASRSLWCNAIEWKTLRHNATKTPLVISNMQLADRCWDPTLATMASCLNQNEADSAVFSPIDPTGSWLSASAANAGELSVGIAMAMYLWQTPVYVMVDRGFESAPGYWAYAVVEEIKFTIESSAGVTTLHDLCQDLGFESSGSDVNTVDADCEELEGSLFSIQSVKISYWNDDWSPCGTIPPRKTHTFLNEGEFVNAVTIGGTIPYVFDPPGGMTLKAFQAVVRRRYEAIETHLVTRDNNGRRTLVSELAHAVFLERQRSRAPAPQAKMVQDCNEPE